MRDSTLKQHSGYFSWMTLIISIVILVALISCQNVSQFNSNTENIQTKIVDISTYSYWNAYQINVQFSCSKQITNSYKVGFNTKSGTTWTTYILQPSIVNSVVPSTQTLQLPKTALESEIQSIEQSNPITPNQTDYMFLMPYIKFVFEAIPVSTSPTTSTYVGLNVEWLSENQSTGQYLIQFTPTNSFSGSITFTINIISNNNSAGPWTVVTQKVTFTNSKPKQINFQIDPSIPMQYLSVTSSQN